MYYYLRREKLAGLLLHLSKEWSVLAPFRNSYGDVTLENLDSVAENGRAEEIASRLALGGRTDSAQLLSPPKEVFFPQSEILFQFSEKGNGEFAIEQPEGKDDPSGNKPKLLFGIKPCDYHALLMTGRFFLEDNTDFYYSTRANGSMVIIDSCIVPPEPEACFCSSAGTGPLMKRGDEYDIQLVEEGNGFIVDVASSRGEDFVSGLENFFKIADEKETARRLEEIRKEAVGNVELKVDFKGALEIMKESPEEGETGERLPAIYREIADRCIYCGACLYLCPTCTCFNVYDNSNFCSVLTLLEEGERAGERVRVWDGCVFSGYSREASGHNPRDDAYKRAERRYEHKLRYDPVVYGRSTCVGCGRCLTGCPVDIGMLKFIEEVTVGNEE